MPVYLCRPGYDTDEPWRHAVQVYASPFPMDDTVVSGKAEGVSSDGLSNATESSGDSISAAASAAAAAAAATTANRVSLAGSEGDDQQEDDGVAVAGERTPPPQQHLDDDATTATAATVVMSNTQQRTRSEGENASGGTARPRRVTFASDLERDEGETTERADCSSPPESGNRSVVGSTVGVTVGGIALRRIRHSEVLLVDRVSIHHGRYWLRLRLPGSRGGFAGYVALGRAPSMCSLGVGASLESSGPPSGVVSIVPERHVIMQGDARGGASSGAGTVALSSSFTLWNRIDNATTWQQRPSPVAGEPETSSVMSAASVAEADSAIRRRMRQLPSAAAMAMRPAGPPTPQVEQWLPMVLEDVLQTIRQVQMSAGRGAGGGEGGNSDIPDATSRCKSYWRRRTRLTRAEFKLLWSHVKFLALREIVGSGGGDGSDITSSRVETDAVSGRSDRQVVDRDGAADGEVGDTTVETAADYICPETNLVFPTSNEMMLLPHYDDGIGNCTEIHPSRRKRLSGSEHEVLTSTMTAGSGDYAGRASPLPGNSSESNSATDSEDDGGEQRQEDDFKCGRVVDQLENEDATSESFSMSTNGAPEIDRGATELVLNGSDVFDDVDDEDAEDTEDAEESVPLADEDNADTNDECEDEDEDADADASFIGGLEPVFCRICREGLHDVEYQPIPGAGEPEVETSATSRAAATSGSHPASTQDVGGLRSDDEPGVGSGNSIVRAQARSMPVDYTDEEEEVYEDDAGSYLVLTPAEVDQLRQMCSGHPAVENPLLSPCECSGSMAFVHYLCVEQWRCRSRHPAAQHGTHCETCGRRYSLPPPPPRPGAGRANARLAGRGAPPFLDRIVMFGDGGVGVGMGAGGIGLAAAAAAAGLINEDDEDWMEAMPAHVIGALRRPHFWWQVGVAIVRRRHLRPLAPIVLSPMVALYCRARRILKKRGVSRRRWSCSLCRRRARWKCVRCLRSYYCSRQCQNVSWHILHKHVCYKPSRFWWSVVAYAVALVAVCPGVVSDPLPYTVGICAVLPSCFVVVGVLGGGLAGFVKHTLGFDVRGRYLELLVVLGTIAMSHVAWGPVWGFFGRPERCMGITLLDVGTFDGGPLALQGITLSLTSFLQVSHYVTQDLLRRLILRPAASAMRWVDNSLANASFISKWICDGSGFVAPSRIQGSSLEDSSKDAASLDAPASTSFPPSFLMSPPWMWEKYVRGSSSEFLGGHVNDGNERDMGCFPMLRRTNADFLHVHSGKKCASDTRFLTPIWLAAGTVILLSSMFKRRDRRARFRGRGGGGGGAAAAPAGGVAAGAGRRGGGLPPGVIPPVPQHEHQD